jgi:hypothetical protein
MLKRPCQAAGIAVLLLFLSTPVAQADLIIGNFPSNDSHGFSLINGGNGLGEEFLMGATSYALDSVELRLFFADVANVHLQVAIYGAGVTGRPGPLLETFTNPPLQNGAFVTYTFTPNSPFNLEANTHYWLVTNALPGSALVEVVGSSPAVTPTGPGATYLDQAFGVGNPPTGPGTGSASTFQVNGTPGVVPEPSTLVLFVLGASGLALGGWRRKRPSA